jgi:hypothetical protein
MYKYNLVALKRAPCALLNIFRNNTPKKPCIPHLAGKPKVLQSHPQRIAGTEPHPGNFFLALLKENVI